MNVVGLIIAGGRATRMGADKPFVRFRDGCLIDAVIARVQPQVEDLMLNLNPDQIGWSAYREKFAVLPDPFHGSAGPLGGIVAGLQALSSARASWLATFPCDTPFLPLNLVATLQAAAETNADRPVVAEAGGRVQSLCALWPKACLEPLREGVASGAFRSVWRMLDALGAVRTEVVSGPHAFFNINTPADLAEADRLAQAETC
jgi:molybdenum cofactor guanylyltransferase